jgi:hypothetical protein
MLPAAAEPSAPAVTITSTPGRRSGELAGKRGRASTAVAGSWTVPARLPGERLGAIEQRLGLLPRKQQQLGRGTLDMGQERGRFRAVWRQ